MSDLARKVFELFGKPGAVEEYDKKQARRRSSPSPSPGREDPPHPPDASEKVSAPRPHPLTDEERAFLARHARNLPWQESPGWGALQVWVRELGMYVWLVRDQTTGEEYARATGTPALVVSEAAACQGRAPQEARATLLPLLIIGGVQ